MIEYKCLQCGHDMSSPDALSGQMDKCTACRHFTKVPKPETEPYPTIKELFLAGEGPGKTPENPSFGGFGGGVLRIIMAIVFWIIGAFMIVSGFMTVVNAYAISINGAIQQTVQEIMHLRGVVVGIAGVIVIGLGTLIGPRK